MMRIRIRIITFLYIFFSGVALVTLAGFLSKSWPAEEVSKPSMAELNKYWLEKQSAQYKTINIILTVGFVLVASSSIMGGIYITKTRKRIVNMIAIIPGMSVCIYYGFLSYEMEALVNTNKSLISVPSISMIEQLKAGIASGKFSLRERERLLKEYEKNGYLINRAPQEILFILKSVDASLTLNPGQLETLSAEYAKLVYLKYGEVAEVLSINGDKKVYKPTDIEEKIRSGLLNVTSTWEINKNNFPYRFPFWISVVIISCIVGIVLPVQEYR